MAIKPHKSLRTIETTAFNKNKFKGNYEKITDQDLTQTLYIYEPITLSKLPKDTDKFLYQQAWTRWNNGGRVFVSLVKYEEQPEIKVRITSRAGDFKGLERDDIISAFTITNIGNRPTKRFYMNKPLNEIVLKPDGEIDLEKTPDLVIYEENNFVEIINNDDTIKQYGLTLGKVLFWDGGENSFYRNVKFYYNQKAWVDGNEFGFTSYSRAWIGNIMVKNITNKTLNVKFNDIKKKYLVYDEDNPENNNKPVIVSKYKYIDDDGVFTDKETQIDAHLVVPMVANSKPKFKLPWLWEFLYAKAQMNGTYYWEGISDAENSGDRPNYSVGSGHTWDKSTPGYRRIKSKTRFEANGRKILHYFLSYTIEHGLPSGLSSHGATYYANDDESSGGGIFGLQYETSSLNGARPENTKGLFEAGITIFALDNAYDPTVLSIAGDAKFYLSTITYGKFYGSDKYKELLVNILKDEAVYVGTAFSSKMSVLNDIKTKAVDDDIRKWKNDDDWTMYITNLDTLAFKNELDSELVEAPAYPKLKSGFIDFTPFSIRTNNVRPFNNLLIKDETFADIPGNDIGFIGNLDSNGIGEIEINSYQEGDVSLYIKSDSNLFYLKVPSDVKEGRSLSGGTKYTFL